MMGYPAVRRAGVTSLARAVAAARPVTGMTFGANASPADCAVTDDVVRRAQAGDLEAFEALYRACAPAVQRLCRRMAGTDADPGDLVQDVFVRAWEKLASFRGESSLATWLHRLGVNVILERLGASRRDALRFSDDAMDDLPSPRGETSASRIDARLDLDRALALMPAGARTVLVLHDVHGYSHDEIAQMTGTAPGTSRAQLWRARRHLLRILGT